MRRENATGFSNKQSPLIILVTNLFPYLREQLCLYLRGTIQLSKCYTTCHYHLTGERDREGQGKRNERNEKRDKKEESGEERGGDRISLQYKLRRDVTCITLCGNSILCQFD